MAKTFQLNPTTGNYEIYDNGKLISTTSSKSYAQSLGATEQTTSLPSQETTRETANTLPQTSTPTTPPVVEQTGNNILDFAATLSTVNDLARSKRQKLVLNKFGKAFPQGSLIASDFNPILSGLERSAQGTLGETLDIFNQMGGTSGEGGGNTFERRSVGGNVVEYEVNPQGQVVDQRVISQGDSDDGGGSDFEDARQVLEQSKGSDGYVNTEVYVNALKAWPKGADDFFKKFPPGLYVNPDDPTVPDSIFYQTLKR